VVARPPEGERAIGGRPQPSDRQPRRAGRVRLWDPITGRLTAASKATPTGRRHSPFRPNGSRLATAGADRNVRLWDAIETQSVATLEGHTDRVDALAFFHPTAAT
jgi:WD40 repeat protein